MHTIWEVVIIKHIINIHVAHKDEKYNSHATHSYNSAIFMSDIFISVTSSKDHSFFVSGLSRIMA